MITCSVKVPYVTPCSNLAQTNPVSFPTHRCAGKIKDVAAEMVAQDCYCLLYDNELSPAQLRSLETALLAELPADRPLKILDRTLVLLGE